MSATVAKLQRLLYVNLNETMQCGDVEDDD